MKEILYLAYGSNLHPLWLQSRTPSARVIDNVLLRGWKLYFNKQSHTDGSAKCNIINSGKNADYVSGIVYCINNKEKSALDMAEGGYDCVAMELPDLGEVFVYLARNETINYYLKPYTWYRDIVITGARLHNLPEDYVDNIRKIDVISDPDITRERNYRAIICPCEN